MVNEEAISELQKAIDLIKQNGKDWLDERDIPILEMAIAALELSDSIMLQLDCKMFHSGVDVESTISEATPSVQFAKDTNVPISDCISRQAAIDMIVDNKYSLEYCKEHHIDFAIDVGLAIVKLSDMPSVQPDITPDGTLKVSIDADIANVGRILLSQAGTQYGGLYYKDAQPEIIRCRDCKYWQDQEDGVVEVPICARPQNNHEKYPLVMLIDGDGFCSFAERRTDEPDK